MSTVAEFNPIYTPPGVSLTAPAKGRPWTQPPQFVKIEEVAEYYITAMSNPAMIDKMLESLDTGVPLIAIAEPLMLSGVASGVHSLDAGILVLPVIVEMLITAAEMDGIEYVIFPDELQVDTDKPSSREIKKAIKKAMEAEKTVSPKEIEQIAFGKKVGLMNRPAKEEV